MIHIVTYATESLEVQSTPSIKQYRSHPHILITHNNWQWQLCNREEVVFLVDGYNITRDIVYVSLVVVLQLWW